jgi:hypothetical protein
VWGGSASKADGSATSLSSIFAQQRADDERKHHERSLRRARPPGGTGSWGAGLSASSPLLGPRPAAPPSQSQWGMLPEPSFVPLKDILEQEHSQLEQQRLHEAEVKEQFRIERLIAQERQAAADGAAAPAGGAKGAQANGKGNGKGIGKDPRGAGAGRRGRCGDSTSQEQQQQQDRKAPSDHAATSGQKEAATTEAVSTEAAQLAATPRAAKGTADGGKGGGAKGSVKGGSKGAGRGGGKTGSKGRGRGCGCENEDAMAIAPQTTETTGIGDTLAALV